MLYIVLVLALGALALLVMAVVTANTLWAWISIGVSVLAGVLLLIDWIRQRRSTASANDDAAPDSERGSTDRDRADTSDAVAGTSGSEGEISGDLSEDDSPGDDSPGAAADDVPDEEQTDAADLLVVSELNIEVRVVDEYPRYHLTSCRWLTRRSTIPIAVSEARELGFTPCIRCAPDSTIAAHHRAQRDAQQDESTSG